jgi:hypothetical protein
MTLLDFNRIFWEMRKVNPQNNRIPVLFGICQTSTFGPNPQKIQFIRLRTCFFEKEDIKVRTTQHGGREGEQEKVSMRVWRIPCDWSKMNSTALVIDEQNALSLWSAERPANLVALRIRCLSVRRRQSDMSRRSSVPSDV